MPQSLDIRSCRVRVVMVDLRDGEVLLMRPARRCEAWMCVAHDVFGIDEHGGVNVSPPLMPMPILMAVLVGNLMRDPPEATILAHHLSES